MTTELEAEEIVRQATETLHEKFPDADPAQVEAMVREELGSLIDKPVHDYLLVLTERAVKKRLKSSA